MRIHRLKLAAVAVGLSTALAACGDAGGDTAGGDTPEVEVQEDAASQFEEGSRMAGAGAGRHHRGRALL